MTGHVSLGCPVTAHSPHPSGPKRKAQPSRHDGGNCSFCMPKLLSPYGVIERLPKARNPSHRAMVFPEEGCIERLLRYEGNYMKKHMEWNEGPTVSGERIRASLRLSRKRAWIRARSSRRTRAADSQPRAGLLFHLPLPSISGL